MIFLAVAAPTPGRASRSFAEAELMSTGAVDFSADARARAPLAKASNSTAAVSIVVAVLPVTFMESLPLSCMLLDRDHRTGARLTCHCASPSVKQVRGAYSERLFAQPGEQP